MKELNIIDMFCGGGGESTGLFEAAKEYNFKINMSAINHWERAIETHSANLGYADLGSADLSHADLSYVKEISYIPMICPEEGNFIGWKKAHNKIVKLHIPKEAIRSSATTRKCRCNKAEVLEIFNLDGTIAEERQIASDRDSNFIYEVGKIVEVKNFDKNRWEECTYGIHFFINRQEAINY